MVGKPLWLTVPPKRMAVPAIGFKIKDGSCFFSIGQDSLQKAVPPPVKSTLGSDKGIKMVSASLSVCILNWPLGDM